MPDWTTHVIAGWLTGKAIKRDVTIVVVGSLLPDVFKIQLLFDFLKIDTHGFFDPLHTPIGTILVALLISLLFEMHKLAFFLLLVGASTHYFLDFFLIHVSDGIRLFFPLSWKGYQIHAISSGNYWVTMIAVALAIIFYFLFKKFSHA